MSYDMTLEAPTNCLLKLSILTTDDIVIRHNGTNDCSYALTEQDWKENEKNAYDPSNPIEIYAKSDIYTTPPRYNNFTVKIKLNDTKRYRRDGEEYDNPWLGYIVETITVSGRFFHE